MIEMGDLRKYWARIAQRKKELGLDAPDLTERLRNSGEQRSPEKREMLDRIEERARKAGVPPVKSNR
ncbi:hypothetical protein [Sphingobium yanoikuyae]|jgi:hypothetical protein|uniref:hypothetical protein n=1 Tax=Sphingobium yanoikuyae TaxID=13690 RepID=UPI0035C795A2